MKMALLNLRAYAAKKTKGQMPKALTVAWVKALVQKDYKKV